MKNYINRPIFKPNRGVLMAKEDEISIDFSKIIKFFKGGKKGHKENEVVEHHAEKEELSLDIKSIVNFFIKKRTFFLVLIPILIAIFIRAYPASLPITDDWAERTVVDYYKNQIRQQLTNEYPNLPEKNLNTLVEKQYSTFYQSNKKQIEEQIKQTSESFKEQFKGPDGYVYMPDIDPYTYLRYAENYLKLGHVGDEVINGTQWDNHMIAPKGTSVGRDLHPIVLAHLYKILHFFNPKITVMQSSTYFPIIFSALAVIPVFFIAKMFAGNVGGFFAALMFSINGAFLGRTTWGHADTDAYNILFAVYFVWFVLLAIKSADFNKAIIYSSAAGLTIGLFSLFWPGWWYVFDFVFGMLVIYGAYLFFEQKTAIKDIFKNESIRKYLLISSAIVVASFLFISIFMSPVPFIRFLYEPISFTTIKQAAHETLWPNVYTTVAELNAASIDTIISSVGGKIFFYASLVGLILLFLYKSEGRRKYLPHAILIALWYIGIIYASTKGIRFTMMLVPPLSLALGAFIGILHDKTVKYMKKLEVSPKITGAIFIVLVLLMFLPYAKAVTASVKNDIPIINDAWYNSLNKIKLQSAQNAIVNSWWDFGHHFKYYADRAVTFDGASQNSPMAHWIGKVLLTSDEKEAIGILRMLDCGSNDAFEELNKINNDTHKTVEMLYDIVKLSKSEANSYLLSKGLNNEQINTILRLTHCEPPENYFITSDDMVSKAGVWAHFGSWDFLRAEIWKDVKNMNRDAGIAYLKKLGYSDTEAESIYFEVKSITSEQDANTWIAPWPSYASGLIQCSRYNETLICGGVKINLNTYDVDVSTQQSGVVKPYSLVYEKNNSLEEIKFENYKLSFSIVLINKDETYYVVISSPELAKSMFTRLFFMEGKTTNQFELFSKERQVTGGMIYVWKVKW